MKKARIYLVCCLALLSNIGFAQQPVKKEKAAREALCAEVTHELRLVNVPALERAVVDLHKEYPSKYKNGNKYLAELKSLGDPAVLLKNLRKDPLALKKAERMALLKRKILLENPALNFKKVMYIRRKGASGLPANYHSNISIKRNGYDNEIVTLSLEDLNAPPQKVFRPANGAFAGDICLHFEGDRFLFSMPSTKGNWQVFEIGVDGKGLRQVTPDAEPEVHNYDACYLPDGDYLFASTAPMVSVPCVNGSALTASFHRMDAKTKKMRQLCFDQEHNWTPRVMANGQILYQRWEYTDTPHSNTRLLMCMNPDGTNQREFYGSNSYWPTSFFYAKPMPGHPTKVIGIATGHHGAQRTGEMHILDPALGRREGEGSVQQVPGYGKKFQAYVRDPYGSGKVPSFIHPEPINDKYIIVSCVPYRGAHWGIYLVDVWDNILMLKGQEPGMHMFEPTIVRKRPVPPVIPDRTDPSRKDALLYIADIYRGPGLAGVERGAVKELRLFTYNFGYHGAGGLYGVLGMDGPWDIKRVLGTVPVEKDGSAFFRVPAKTPISIQPLDEDGKAMQLMRSWLTAQSGETLSCIGCHESQNSAPLVSKTTAQTKKPAEIKPWYGPERGFSFVREVQPVLDKYCVSCHGGSTGLTTGGSKPEIMDLKGGTLISDYRTNVSGNGGGRAGKFTKSYANLFPYVRGSGIENDYHLLTPMEFNADTTELVQLLRKGHHNVRLDREAWDRLFTWIDLNTPFHGSWGAVMGRNWVVQKENQRAALRKKYAGVDINHEAELPPVPEVEPVIPEPEKPVKTADIKCGNWPFDSAKAKEMQSKSEQVIEFGDGLKMHMVYIPAGEFVMGSVEGHRDEAPRKEYIKRGFWMGKFEVTNEQYSRFDEKHDSKVAIRSNYQFGVRDLPMSAANQPVVRVSFNDAEEFCRWMSDQTDKKMRLPSEREWEWACRAGTDTQFYYGDINTNFSEYANLSDLQVRKFAANTSAGGYTRVAAIPNPSKYDDFIPKDARFDDGSMITCDIGKYKPNAWGLHDMHGNVAEWTSSEYRSDFAGRTGCMIVRGGSWRDRPKRATSSCRLFYRPYHKVFNVGFRVVMEDK